MGDSWGTVLASGKPPFHPRDPPHGKGSTALVGLSDGESFGIPSDSPTSLKAGPKMVQFIDGAHTVTEVNLGWVMLASYTPWGLSGPYNCGRFPTSGRKPKLRQGGFAPDCSIVDFGICSWWRPLRMLASGTELVIDGMGEGSRPCRTARTPHHSLSPHYWQLRITNIPVVSSNRA